MTLVTGAALAQPNRPGRARELAGGVLDVVTGSGPAAWESIPDDSTHHFLLQDSMVLSSTFFERANAAVKAMPNAALVLFATAVSRNGGAVRQGALAGARWVPAVHEYLPAAGIILPVHVAHRFVSYARAEANNWPENALMSRFLRQQDIPTFVSVPNLVDVLADKDNSSACFFDYDAEESEEPGLAELSVIPFYRNGVAECAIRMLDGWRTIRCEEYLRRFDIQPDELPKRTDFHSESQRNVWLTGFAMGVVNRFEGHGVNKSGLVLDRALATIGPDGTHAWAWDGLHAGLAVSPKSSDRSSPSVRVACGNSFLGEHLRFMLAGRGYHVTTSSPADVVVHLDGLPTPAEGARLAICLSSLRSRDERLLPGVKSCVLRLGDAYGPHMPADDPVAQFVRASLSGQPADFAPAQLVHVNDIVDAVEAVLRHDAPGGVYAIANRETTGTAELCQALDLPVRKSARAGAVPIDLAERELGWRPSVDLSHGLRTYAEWLTYET